MAKVLIFAGTTEGRILAKRLKEQGCQDLVSVATDYGKELLEDVSVPIYTGRMDGKEMAEFIRRHSIDLVIDATHPYAKEVTKEILCACKETGTERIRCLRQEELLTAEEEEQLAPWIVHVSSAEEAAQWLKGKKGNVLLCTGSKELAFFAAIPDFEQRIYARVLPVPSVLTCCKKLGLKGRHVIAAQGPFSMNFNIAMIQEYDCRVLVTKDGGKEGGYLEKIKAAAKAKIPALVIDRPKEETGMSAEEVMQWYETRKQRL